MASRASGDNDANQSAIRLPCAALSSSERFAHDFFRLSDRNAAASRRLSGDMLAHALRAEALSCSGDVFAIRKS